MERARVELVQILSIVKCGQRRINGPKRALSGAVKTRNTFASKEVASVRHEYSEFYIHRAHNDVAAVWVHCRSVSMFARGSFDRKIAFHFEFGETTIASCFLRNENGGRLPRGNSE